ncbi:MAG TPA: hypothetical protein VGL56_17100 [Fimbriimonadaceae bacterium]
MLHHLVNYDMVVSAMMLAVMLMMRPCRCKTGHDASNKKTGDCLTYDILHLPLLGWINKQTAGIEAKIERSDR